MTDPSGSVNGGPPRTAPDARHLRLPTAPAELSAGLAWAAMASKGRVSKVLIKAIMEHQRRTRCEPAVLIAAVVQYLIQNADREPDFLNRYWHIADQVSARTRARYLNTDEQDLL